MRDVLSEYVRVGEEGVVGGGERMIETSNQPRCREQRAGRGLLPTVTPLSVPVSHSFPLVRGSLGERSVA